MIKTRLISDIELRLTKGKPSDDLELERSLISHWLDSVRDELVYNECIKAIKNGNGVNPYYLEREVSKVVTVEDDASEAQDRFYLTMTNVPMSLPRGRGIVKVQLTDGTPVLPTTIEYLDVVNQLPYGSASPDRPMYYRLNDKLYVVGLADNETEDSEFNIFYISSYSNNTIAEDDDFKISDELLPVLLDEVEQIARRERQSDEDLENDGIQ